MKKDELKNSLVERLRSCPKLECNFWSLRNFNSHYDGDVSEIGFEGGFWSNEGSDLAYLAAKRFGNNLSDNHDVSDALSKGLYLRETTIDSHQCGDESNHVSTDSQIPRTPAKDNFEELSFFRSCALPSMDDKEDRKPDNETQVNGKIPGSEQMCDKKNSFSALTIGTTSMSNFGSISGDGNILFHEAQGIDELYERIVDTSSLSSSFDTPNNFNAVDSREYPLSPYFSFSTAFREHSQRDDVVDVKTAKSLTLFVDEYPENSFFSLIESLQSNNVIERIVIFRERTTEAEKRARPLEDMDNLFHAIRNLSKSLVELVLWNFHPEDLLSFSIGISNHPSIGNLNLHMESGTLDQQTLETITTMPSLISLELEVNESFPVWSLLESDSLVLLAVVSTKFDFATNDVLRMAGRIRTNSVLRVLDLEPRIPSWCIGAVMASLRFSHTSQLETFRFSCQNDNEDQGDACMAEILKTIDYETSLSVLWNHSQERFSVSKEMRRETLSAVNRNPSLKQFHLFKDNED